jgi:putative effector of murein hydrolase LrgA (UPF0299 family)
MIGVFVVVGVGVDFLVTCMHWNLVVVVVVVAALVVAAVAAASAVVVHDKKEKNKQELSCYGHREMW